MINHEEWGLTQQNVMSTQHELTKLLEFKIYPNVTMALQFNKKK